MTGKLASGEWLTVPRMKAYCVLLLIGTVAALVALVVTSQGGVDRWGRPLGTDFTCFWTAGKLTLEGVPEAAYDHARHHAEQKAAFGGRDVPFYSWLYPPLFLMPVALLALMPYLTALVVWMAATLGLYLAVLHRIAPSSLTVAAGLAYPAVFVTLTHGQNAFLIAALLGGALLVLDRRPVLAGVLIACLAFKPHFGLLLPLVLALTGRWRTFLAATVTLGLLVGLSVALFGPQTWLAMFDSISFTRTTLLDTGAIGWEKIQSLLAALRHAGLGSGQAYAAQAVLTLALAAAVAWIWRSTAAYPLKAAALVTAALLATPYLVDYDMAVLGLAIAWFTGHGLRHGFLAWEKTLLAAVWISPLMARSVAEHTYVPLGLLAMLTLFALILRRIRHERGQSAA